MIRSAFAPAGHAPLADRLNARAWDDDVDDESRALLEEAAAVVHLQAAALEAAGIVIDIEAAGSGGD